MAANQLDDALVVADYRRRVSDLYTGVRANAAADGWEAAWRGWRDGRTQLFQTHPASPFAEQGRASRPLPHFDYDPSWHLIGRVHLAAVERFEVPHSGVGSTWFERVGLVTVQREGQAHELELFWLDAYGGGFFLPFRDATCGTQTYGGGRYLLDGAKAADLGGDGDQLVLDFNFAYHPSCAHDPAWSCPLAPPGNRLDVAVRAGERR